MRILGKFCDLFGLISTMGFRILGTKAVTLLAERGEAEFFYNSPVLAVKF